jgi:hypothetical protein
MRFALVRVNKSKTVTGLPRACCVWCRCVWRWRPGPQVQPPMEQPRGPTLAALICPGADHDHPTSSLPSVRP